MLCARSSFHHQPVGIVLVDVLTAVNVLFHDRINVAGSRFDDQILNGAGSPLDDQTNECCWKSLRRPGFLVPLSVCYETPVPTSTKNLQHQKRINSVARKGQKPKEGATRQTRKTPTTERKVRLC